MSTLDRRAFVGLAGTAGMTLLFAKPAPAQPAPAGSVSLAGAWRFALDRDDAGVDAGWFGKPLASEASIKLPGILQTQGYGDDITAETQFIAALPRDMRWYLLPQYKAYTKPGNVQVPYLSQPVRHFLGVAWYQREITIPAAWKGKRVSLLLERARWRTDIYLDDKLAGTNRSLVAPHQIDLGVLTPGTHRLSIRIDNRMLQPSYRPDGHSVSDAEGATWNGIVGRIELSATSPVWIDDAQVFPNLAAKSAQVRVKLGNLTGKAGQGRLTCGATSAPVSWTAAGGEASLDVAMPNAQAWSEFNPVLQHLTVTLTGPDADDHRDLTFGMREIKADGDVIRLNGELLYLRATHDGGGFPLTGYPAMDVATWKAIMGICKAWGLNGMRFHSWCPPEAAFTAADEIGFYLQPECGMWNAFDAQHQMLDLLNDETARLIKAYGNHPSLTFLAATNEPAGNYQAQLPTWDLKWRQADPRRLYTDGTGRFAPPPGGAGTAFAADYLVGGARGSPGWNGGDYEQSMQRQKNGVHIPCLGHEIGQYCAYPDFSVIEKFAGKQARYEAFPDRIGSGREPYMHPGNYIIWRDSAREHGLLGQNKALAQASGRFQLACYKEEIEANLRTPSYCGFEMLDIHDYLGQGGALIGLLDAFWETKGYARPEEFKQFNNTTVPLVRLKQRTFTTADSLTATAELAHYGPKPLTAIDPSWRVVDAAGKVVASGALPPRDAPRGKSLPLGTITVDLSKLPAPAAYRLELELAGFNNQWSFWVYPASVSAAAPNGVAVTASWDEAKAALASGGRVLFLSGSPATPSVDLTVTTEPIFWNRLMNPTRTWMLGLLNDANHAAFKGFPTEASCDWQWTPLLAGASAMNIDTLPHELQPLVMPIDDWNRNLRLAMLFECGVGQGRLMATSLDLSDAGLAKHPGAMALRRSLLDYMASADFRPKISLSPRDIDAWAASRYVAPPLILTPPATGDVADPSAQTPPSPAAR